jgi:DNA-binding transcriptional ArsR family regulator
VKAKVKWNAVEQAKVFAALSDPMRVRMMEQLAKGAERTGTELAGELGISLALLCHHSKILGEADLIEKRKVAQTSLYKAKRETLEKAFEAIRNGCG